MGLNYGKRWQHTVYYRYSDRLNLPDYSVTDTRLSWTGKVFTLFADVTNVFDKPYRETNLVELPEVLEGGMQVRALIPGRERHGKG